MRFSDPFNGMSRRIRGTNVAAERSAEVVMEEGRRIEGQQLGVLFRF